MFTAEYLAYTECAKVGEFFQEESANWQQRKKRSGPFRGRPWTESKTSLQPRGVRVRNPFAFYSCGQFCLPKLCFSSSSSTWFKMTVTIVRPPPPRSPASHLSPSIPVVYFPGEQPEEFVRNITQSLSILYFKPHGSHF